MHSLTDISQTLCELEREFALLDLDVDGVKVWQAGRYDIYHMVARQAGLINEPQMTRVRPVDHMMNSPRILKSFLFHNPLLDRAPVDTLVFDHERKVFVDGAWIDIHTEWFLKQMEEEGLSFSVLENRHIDRHLTHSQKNRSHTDFFYFLARIYEKISFRRLDPSVRETLVAVEQELRAKYGVELDLCRFLQKRYREFLALRFIWQRFFKLKSPRRIVIVFAYGFPALIAAAKSLGIETIEIQHGIIFKGHLGYDYPVPPSGEVYFPDQLWIWDEMWRDGAAFPLPAERIKRVGFHYAEEQRKKVAHIEKKANQLTVISQGAIGKQLSERVYAAATSLRDLNIVYKLHPGEYERWQLYPALVELAKLPNVEVLATNNRSLYELLAESAFVLGAYSTALFEALDLDCKVVIADLPGTEGVRDILKRSGKCESLDEFLVQLNRNKDQTEQDGITER